MIFPELLFKVWLLPQPKRCFLCKAEFFSAPQQCFRAPVKERDRDRHRERDGDRERERDGDKDRHRDEDRDSETTANWKFVRSGISIALSKLFFFDWTQVSQTKGTAVCTQIQLK